MKWCLITILAVVSLVSGCAKSSAIQKASETEWTIQGEPEYSGFEAPIEDQYRIYHQAATGFVPISSIRQSAENRAIQFCSNKNQSMNIVSEKIRTIATWPDFPQIEIVFACTDKDMGNEAASAGTQDDRYDQIREAKQLFDEGILTEEEYEAEKDRILDAP